MINESGICHCGCEGQTALAKKTDSRRGWVRGEPIRFIHGHHVDPPAQERFWGMVNKRGPYWNGTRCWEWLASTKKGYGYFYLDYKIVFAHRTSYEWAKGAIPTELQIDHLCRNHGCVRPSHLEAVTASVNVIRGYFSRGKNANRQRAMA